jgi:hypothetical protein
MSSPYAPINSPNSNNQNQIPAKKSLRVYPIHFGILKK